MPTRIVTGPPVAPAPPRVRCRSELRLSPEDGGQRVLVLDERSDRQFRMSADAARMLALLDGTRTNAQIAAELGGVDGALLEQAIAKLIALDLVESTGPAGPAGARPGGARPGGRGRYGKKAMGRTGGRHRHVVRHAARSTRQTRPAGRHRLPRSEYPPSPWRAVQQSRRFKFRPPGTVEFSFGDPGRVLSRLRPVADALSTTLGQIAVTALLLAGVAVFVATWPDRLADVSRPAPVAVAGTLFLVSLATTFAHEFGHGLSLVRAGGRVRRLGMTVLYGSPSFFCDVSQAWRLPPRRRVWVALAGARVHLTVGAAAAIGAALLPPGDLRQLLSAMAFVDLVMSLINLCPFVKFDGYIALMGWLDRPHLRAKSMAAVRNLAGRLVFGRGRTGRRPGAPALRPGVPGEERMGPGWLVYGLVCMLVTPAFVGWALLNYGPMILATFGRVGAALLLLLYGYLLLIPARSVAVSARTAAAARVPRWRIFVGLLAVTTVLSGALNTVPVPSRTTSVYTMDPTGVALVVVPSTVDVKRLGEVELQRSGLVRRPRTASGRVCGPVRKALVDPNAGSPVLPLENTRTEPVRRRVVPVCVRSGTPDATGFASLSTGDVPAARWLYQAFVLPAFGRLL